MRPRFLRVEFRVSFYDRGTLDACLETLIQQNLWQMRTAARQRVVVPPLYRSNVVYRRDPPRKEWFRSWARVLTTGWGDCDDLAALRAAELRMDGAEAWARAIDTPNPNTLHAVVTDRAGSIIEDPCAVLAALGRYDA